ncbi:MAG: hypothetical protein AB8B83_07495 [Bdellovibrionales bacterium]
MSLGLREQGALTQRFGVSEPEQGAGLDLSDYIGTRQNLLGLTNNDTEEGLKRGIQVQMGMGDIENLAAALRGANGATAALLNQQRTEKTNKKSREARRLQLLLDQIRDLEQKIVDAENEIDRLNTENETLQTDIDELTALMTQLVNGEISEEDAMQDPRIRDRIAEWERENGRRFDPEDPNAQAILLDIIQAQIDENEARIGQNSRHIGDLEEDIEGWEREKDQTQERLREIDATALTNETLAVEQASELALESQTTAIEIINNSEINGVVDVAIETYQASRHELHGSETDLPPVGGKLEGLTTMGQFETASALPGLGANNMPEGTLEFDDPLTGIDFS